MRLFAVFVAATLAQKGGRREDDVLARLDDFKKWGKECAGELEAKQNVKKKLVTMNRMETECKKICNASS